MLLCGGGYYSLATKRWSLATYDGALVIFLSLVALLALAPFGPVGPVPPSAASCF